MRRKGEKKLESLGSLAMGVYDLVIAAACTKKREKDGILFK